MKGRLYRLWIKQPNFWKGWHRVCTSTESISKVEGEKLARCYEGMTEWKVTPKERNGMKKKQDWSDSRTKELKELRNLLFKLYDLDDGNGFIRNVRNCIRVAGRLVSSHRNLTQPSFIDHLESLCIKERERQKMDEEMRQIQKDIMAETRKGIPSRRGGKK